MSDRKTIWVTGADGQLGNELQLLAPQFGHLSFLFTSRSQVAIDDDQAVEHFLQTHHVNACINAAAYTAVDMAESDRDASMQVNGFAVGQLSLLCRNAGARFLHVSTDYVFNGKANVPYKETDETDPVNYYGQTKLKGEQLALANNADSVIVRTSWVYSHFGKNFVKTMLRLMEERDSIGVVADQFGCPTYAGDLARAILHLAISEKTRGVYHYCNEGVISWFDFATAIRDMAGLSCEVKPILTSDYPTPAKRPAYSALDTNKFRSKTGLTIPAWLVSLERCIALLKP